MEQMLVHIDVASFMAQTHERVIAVIDGSIRILYDAYRALGIRQIGELAASLEEQEISTFTTF